MLDPAPLSVGRLLLWVFMIATTKGKKILTLAPSLKGYICRVDMKSKLKKKIGRRFFVFVKFWVFLIRR